MLLRTLAAAGTPLSVKDLASKCDLESATAWRLLWTLQTHGLVEKVDDTRVYRLGIGFMELSMGNAVDSLARVGRPILRRLAADHEVTASIAALERFRVVYVDQVDSARFPSPDWRGREVSLHGSSPGKAILAALPPHERHGMLGPSLPKLTETTVTDLGELETELATVRERGYAVCHGEDVTYSNGASAAVSINGRVIGAIDLWGPERLVPWANLGGLGAAASNAARELESLLRGDSGD